MQKEKKTAQELADMIGQRLNIGGVFIAVHKDPAYGWHPTIMTRPVDAINCQTLVEEIAKDLRTKYELKE
jgi:hypothetical protein